MQLSVQDVASQMRLEPRVLEALETENFAMLPAPLYVRGYIRAYAKILKLDANPLIALYNDESATEPPEIIPEVKHATQTSSSDKPVKAFTYLVTFTLFILLVAWWQSSFVLRGAPEPAATTPAPSTAVPGSATATPGPAITTVPVNAGPVPQNTGPSEYRAPPESDLPADTAASGNSGAVPETPGAEPAPAGATVSTPAVATDDDSAAPVPTGPDTLGFDLSADSWIEVYDAGGQQIYKNLGRAGDHLSLGGTAPFTVLLGYAQGVKVVFNGKAFDPAPYSRSGIARFTLGSAAPAQVSPATPM